MNIHVEEGKNASDRELLSELFENPIHPQAAQALAVYEPHKEHNMASNYNGSYGIFYKISMEVA